jgi:hypothetical protein
VALWQLYFETGRSHGDPLINRTTGSGRLPLPTNGRFYEDSFVKLSLFSTLMGGTSWTLHEGVAGAS